MILNARVLPALFLAERDDGQIALTMDGLASWPPTCEHWATMAHLAAPRALRLRPSCGAATLALTLTLALVAACGTAPPLDPERATASSQLPETATSTEGDEPRSGTAAVSYATAGDACTTGFACSIDATLSLRCEGGMMVVHGLCRGPKHCRANERGVRCDQTVAEIDDACDGDDAACSVDGINLLVCRDGRRKLKSACTTGCEVQRKMGLVMCVGTGVTP